MGFEKLPYEFGLTEKMYAGRKTKWCGRKHSSITCCYLPFPPPPKKKKVTFILSSARALNLDQSRISSIDKELKKQSVVLTNYIRKVLL